MHSFILIGSSADLRSAKAKEQASKLSQGVDLVVFENPKGIDSAREIKASLTRKPYQSPAISIILAEAQNLTVEAQNALLKTLEEPPGPTQIYITAPTTDSFLPTVLSRCQIIDLGPLESHSNEADLKKAWTLWQEGRLGRLWDATDLELAAWTALARALLFYKLGTEEASISAALDKSDLKKFAKQLHTQQLRNFLKACQRTNELLQTNVNRKLAMENLLLSLPYPYTTSQSR